MENFVRGLVDRIFGKKKDKNHETPQWNYNELGPRIPVSSRGRFLRHVYPFAILCQTIRNAGTVAEGNIWEFAPGTCLISALCVAPFCRPKGWLWAQVAFSPQIALFWRPSSIFVSNFMHMSLGHLISSLIGIVQDGTLLETQIGGKAFLADVAILSTLSRIIHIIYAYLNLKLVNWAEPLLSQQVGLDSTCVALRVLNSHTSGLRLYLWGLLPIPPRIRPLSCWIDVALSFAMHPQYSPTTHFSGIAAGLVLVYAPWIWKKLRGVYYRRSYRLVDGNLRRDSLILDRLLGRHQRLAHRPIDINGHNLHPLSLHLLCAGLTAVVAYIRRHKGGY